MSTEQCVCWVKHINIYGLGMGHSAGSDDPMGSAGGVLYSAPHAYQVGFIRPQHVALPTVSGVVSLLDLPRKPSATQNTIARVGDLIISYRTLSGGLDSYTMRSYEYKAGVKRSMGIPGKKRWRNLWPQVV